jgi:hypothetical protein
MARIRSVHPGLFTDEAFMALTVNAPTAIPLMLGLWADADDSGIFEWKPFTLKARYVPAITVPVDDLLDILINGNFIRRLEHGGRQFGAVRNFCRYQRPKKPRYVHFIPDEFRTYVGLSGASSEPTDPEEDAGSELAHAQPPPVPKKGEKSSQMEGRGEKGRIPSSVSNETSDAPKTDLLGEPPLPEPADAKLYRLGRDVLGPKSGGVVKKLLAAKGGSILSAMAALQTASEKAEPMAYAQACIRGSPSPAETADFEELRRLGEAW